GAGHHHGARRRDVERGLAQPVRGRPLATAAAPGEKGKEEEEEEEKEDEEEQGQGGLRAPRAAAPFAREERARPPARGAIAHPSSFSLTTLPPIVTRTPWTISSSSGKAGAFASLSQKAARKL